MAQQKPHRHLLITVLGLVIALGFLIYVASIVRQGAGTMVSRASRDVFLTPGDDALSLQEDLKNLGADPGVFDEQQLNTIQ